MTIKLYGTNWCSDCKRSKKFLGEQRVRYDFIDIEEDEKAQEYVRELQKGACRSQPLCLTIRACS
ncbi:glutaredoxin family protein [Dictyobacter kobayashii]|uniref:Glutaredoxin domain-containing protein n=1 Tax=Dictyobacter kobayashii TaxID=2014872 RepID=A0A402AZI5_9CHLR|nr:glutaredoxin family protein [Dictyobacter kobayashii]GCE24483.1 hypothetical protein KDK_82830 [Dictyobacter kobayashii]